MIRRNPLLYGTTGLCLAAALVGLCLAAALVGSGCNNSARMAPPVPVPGGVFGARPGAGAARFAPGGAAAGAGDCDPIPESDRQAILDNVIKLIQTASLKPGGENFGIATQNLNQFFCGTPAARFSLTPEARAFLLQHVSENVVQNLEDRAFRMPDARHIEDCMLYHSIATRVGGVGDDLSRVRRVFHWIVTQIQLVPPGALAAPGLGQAEARPYDVLVRGMATEDGGSWSERGWLFLALCRQLGVDSAFLTYTPPGAKDPIIWTCAALVEGKLYLFDARLGLELTGPGGVGIATLDDALRDPEVLARLDLPGQVRYETTRDSLLGSTSKIGVLLDSSPNYQSPRMALVQENLAGRNRTILYSDASGQRDRFLQAMGAHAGKVEFWELPARVLHNLFNNPRFNEATGHTLTLFNPKEFPLVYARVKELRGELPEAIQEYAVSIRFVENPVKVNKQGLIPPEIQQALDIFSTYFLGLCKLEQFHADQAGSRSNSKALRHYCADGLTLDPRDEAEFFFTETLRLLPEPGRGQPFYNMFRWGAQANLARLCETARDDARAIAYYSQFDPTTQWHGNLIRARELLWPDPAALPPPPLPAAPTPTPFMLQKPPGN